MLIVDVEFQIMDDGYTSRCKSYGVCQFDVIICTNNLRTVIFQNNGIALRLISFRVDLRFRSPAKYLLIKPSRNVNKQYAHRKDCNILFENNIRTIRARTEKTFRSPKVRYQNVSEL